MVGQKIAHYYIREKLGEGASSVVYRAEDTALRRHVALKFLAGDLRDAGSIARFQHEARTVSSLNHPNICTIHEIGEHDGRPYIAMELLEGDVLSRLIGGRPIDPYRVVDLAAQVADALEAAHAEGIVHRDVKPANIFVTRRNQVKLLDFGVAVLVPHRNTGGNATMMSTVGGTIPYMSPEQVRAEALDQRTDLFSLGIVLYEMATGSRPFVGPGRTEVMDAIVNDAEVPARTLNPMILPELERIIDKALEKNPRLRYQTASDMRADLERFKRDLDVPQRAPTPAARPLLVRDRSARVIAAAAGAVAVTAVAAVATVYFARRSDPISVLEPRLETSPSGDVALPAEAPAPAPRVQRSAPPAERTSRAVATASIAAAPEPSPPPARSEPEPVAAPAPASRPASTDDLRIARQKIALKLYDQAIESLHRVAAQGDNARDAVEASFLIASVHELRGAADDATSAYLEVASRHPEDPRAPEALVRMAESTLKSKRRDRDADARQILTDAARKYPASPWAARALLMRGDLESRLNLYQLDTSLGTSAPTALSSYRDIIDHHASSSVAPAAMHRAAEIYVQMRRYELAASLFEELAVRDAENRYDAWFAAGELYDRRLKDPARARAAYARVPHASAHFADAQKRLHK